MSLTLEEYEALNPRSEVEHDGVKMVFATPTTFTLWRVQSIHEKEPWTLDWIAGFAPGEVLVDCGANVGMYTIWVAATRRVRVYAFEPEAQNYALLNRNILLNELSERVTAFCMGLSDAAGLTTLHIADLRAGGSCHALGEALDFKHEPLKAVFRQGCVSTTLDELVPFVPNSLFAFVKTDNSFHGVEPVTDEECRRWLLLYDLYARHNAAKAPPPGPGAAAPAVKFSF